MDSTEPPSPVLRDTQDNQTCTHCGRVGRMIRWVQGDKTVQPWYCPGKAPGAGCKERP